MNNIFMVGKILVTDTICRICLKSCNDTISIFRKFVIETESHITPKTLKTMSVLQLVEYITKVQVYEKFSNMVCKTCVKSALDAFIFKMKLRITELWLQANISQINTLTSTKENNVFKNPVSLSEELNLENGDDLQDIKAWLESKISKLEIDKSKNKKCDNLNLENKTDLQQKSHRENKKRENHPELQETQKGKLESNKKCITIVKRKRKLEVEQQSDINALQKHSEEKINNKMTENLTLKKRKVEATQQFDITKLQVQRSEGNISSIRENINEKNKKSKATIKSDVSTKLQINKIEERVKSQVPENPKSKHKTDLQTSHKSVKAENISEENKQNTTQGVDFKNKQSNMDKSEDKINKTYELLPDCLKDHDYNFIFCDICSTYFPARYPYEEHRKVHTDKDHKCKYCTKQFTTFAHLKNHLKSHAGNTPFSQLLAQYDINYPLYMDSNHEKYFMCEPCVVVYKRFVTLSEHLRIAHATKDKKYCCSVCEEGFNKQGDLQHHLQIHTEGSPYYCVHCSNKFDTIKDLNNHVNSHGIDAPLFRLPYKPSFVKYRKKPEPGDIPFLKEKKDKIYLCPHCGKKYKQRYEYIAHLEYHNGTDKIVCNICGKTYRRLQFNNHMQTHTNLAASHKCGICGKAYKQKATLKQHMLSHTKRTPYSCEACGKQFKERSYLKFHQKYHNSEKKHECHICGKKSMHAGNLATHYRSHTQEKPYTCKYCDKKFRTNTNCKYHQYVHEGKRPFSCNICQSSFTRPYTLKEHMKVHNKTKKET